VILTVYVMVTHRISSRLTKTVVSFPTGNYVYIYIYRSILCIYIQCGFSHTHIPKFRHQHLLKSASFPCIDHKCIGKADSDADGNVMQCGYCRYTLVGHAVVSVVNGEVARTFALCVCVCVRVCKCVRACVFICAW